MAWRQRKQKRRACISGQETRLLMPPGRGLSAVRFPGRMMSWEIRLKGRDRAGSSSDPLLNRQARPGKGLIPKGT